ncbi:MAG TPA: response regulator [bacterium]|nr:response regulator [bacterium]
MTLQTILIVDDNKEFRRSLSLSLRDMGLKILEAGDSIGCFETLMQCLDRGETIDAVVIDGRMPALDGYWLADQIESHWPCLPLVILTAYPRPVNHRNHRVMTKPVKPEELIKTIDHIRLGRNAEIIS